MYVCGECYWYPSCCACWKILTDAIPPANHLHIYFPGQTAPHALVATGDLICLSLIGYWLTPLWQWETINYRLLERGRCHTSWMWGCRCYSLSVKSVDALFIRLPFLFMSQGSVTQCTVERWQYRLPTQFICIGQCTLVLFGKMVRACRERPRIFAMSYSVWVSESLHFTRNWFLRTVFIVKINNVTLCIYVQLFACVLACRGVWIGIIMICSPEWIWIYINMNMNKLFFL